MDFGIGILIATFTIVIIFIILMWRETYKETKSKKELKLRQNDTLLSKYFNEMNNDRNDGWTKGHYEILYKERLNHLKK